MQNLSGYMHLFDSRYKDLRLIDIPGLKALMPITMETFLKHVQDSSKAGAGVLENVWLADCCNLIDQFRDEVEAWMPPDAVYLKKILFQYYLFRE